MDRLVDQRAAAVILPGAAVGVLEILRVAVPDGAGRAPEQPSHKPLPDRFLQCEDRPVEPVLQDHAERYAVLPACRNHLLRMFHADIDGLFAKDVLLFPGAGDHRVAVHSRRQADSDRVDRGVA